MSLQDWKMEQMTFNQQGKLCASQLQAENMKFECCLGRVLGLLGGKVWFGACPSQVDVNFTSFAYSDLVLLLGL